MKPLSENDQKAILAYLVVLNVERHLAELTGYERNLGQASMMGCLHQVEDILSDDYSTEARLVLDSVLDRERVNGRVDINDPELIVATGFASRQLLDYYRRRVPYKNIGELLADLKPKSQSKWRIGLSED